jgi:hypothetical protein
MQAGFEAPTLAELEPRLCGWFFLNGRYHPAAMFNSVQGENKMFFGRAAVWQELWDFR